MRWLTLYRTSERRSSLLEALRCCSVHDHWKLYFTVPDAAHAVQHARLRELRALMELDGEAWAYRMQLLLRMAVEAAWIAGAKGFALRCVSSPLSLTWT